MQDPNPLPWGAQDRFQAHFIVRSDSVLDDDRFVANTVVVTKGRFGAKTVQKVDWQGGQLAERLNEDKELQRMVMNLPVHDAYIFIEPTSKAVRMYGKWKNSDEFAITKDLFDVYDRIAMHVKKLLGSPPVKS